MVNSILKPVLWASCLCTVRSYFVWVKNFFFGILRSHSLTHEKKPSLLFCVRTPSFSFGNWGREFPWPFRQELYQVNNQAGLFPGFFKVLSLISLTNAMGNSHSMFPADYLPHHYGINSVQYLQKWQNFTTDNLEFQWPLWETWDLPILDHQLPIPSYHLPPHPPSSFS